MTLRRSLLLAAALLAAACSKNADRPEKIGIDFAYYNPLSLLLKERGYLDQDLAKDGIKVEWVQSLGSNKALELLSSRSIDFGSTAGAAALLARANGNPVKAVYVYSKPEWTALVTTPGSGIEKVADLRGKKIAVTRGTDPHIFLLRALDDAGLTERDVEIVPLQHPDGRLALERGDVAAWSGLDPLMATSELEKGSKLFFRKPDWNTYGVLDVREDFAKKYPAYVERVIAAYERTRQEALANPEALREVLARNAKLSEPVSRAVIARTDLTHPFLGPDQRATIVAAGAVLKKSGVVKPDTDVEQVATALLDPQFADRVRK
ncbi:MAG: aliphatic sulfonate ABC transporter substrate-binding protein [Anaeromyxobacteraceae bacterium]